jgi:hypothetical protein
MNAVLYHKQWKPAVPRTYRTILYEIRPTTTYKAGTNYDITCIS